MGMDPFSWMAIAALVGGAVGTGMQVEQSQSNATAKNREARNIRGAGAYNANQVYAQYSDIMAKQHTGFGAAGVAESGSALDIEAYQARVREEAVRMKLYEYDLAAQNSEQQADNYEMQSINQGIAGFGSILGTSTKMMRPGKSLNSIPNNDSYMKNLGYNVY